MDDLAPSWISVRLPQFIAIHKHLPIKSIRSFEETYGKARRTFQGPRAPMACFVLMQGATMPKKIKKPVVSDVKVKDLKPKKNPKGGSVKSNMLNPQPLPP
jgi:hypothetical protein